METILKLLEQNAKLTPEQIAVMLGRQPDEVAKTIKNLEENHVIMGYHALIDWDKTDRTDVAALIEIKVAPQKELGFDYVAEQIYTMDEVQSVSLMSGGFDLAVTIEGKTLREVALFVAERLSVIDCVVSTATHFILKRYKEKGVILADTPEDQRGWAEI